MHAGTTVLLQRFHAALTAAERSVVNAIAAEASAQGAAAYLVGGSVRDLLLGCPSPDLDITVEGDAPAIAHEIARRTGLTTPRVHESFGTATLSVGERSIDVITARSERYSAPGALPTVTPSSLADDLARRDFTINAMALALAGPEAGRLIDPHGGATDLGRRLLRVVHTRSFEDDATRLLRGARYIARFRLRMETGTANAALSGRRFLAAISPARIRHEFERIFAEVEPARALAVVAQMGLAGELVKGLQYSRQVLAGYRRLATPTPGPSPAGAGEGSLIQPRLIRTPLSHGAGEGPGVGAVAHWLLPIMMWDAAAISVYADRFDLTHRERVAAAALPEARRVLRRLVRHGEPDSAVVAALERLPEASLVAWACYSPGSGSGRLARVYLDTLRYVRPRLTSNDLLALGVRPGPLFGEVVRRLRAARLDDPSLTLDAEQALVQHVMDEHGGA